MANSRLYDTDSVIMQGSAERAQSSSAVPCFTFGTVMHIHTEQLQAHIPYWATPVK